MLTPEERSEIEEELAHYPQKRGACIEGLKIVQRHRGFVSDEALFDLADFLEMTPAELDSVATFYNLVHRKPVGRHVILICDSVSCWILGYERLLARLREELGIGLGETSADGKFTLLPIQCLGTCDRAPALMIDEDLYRDLDPDRPEPIGEILSRYDGEARWNGR